MPRVNLIRHKIQCTICTHGRCIEIEAMFLATAFKDFGRLSRNCAAFGVSRYAIYRHAHTTGLMRALLIERKRLNKQFWSLIWSQQHQGKPMYCKAAGGADQAPAKAIRRGRIAHLHHL
jgi:hypothetical protein